MLILAAALALAVEPQFSKTAQPEAEYAGPTGKLSAELGAAWTTGNTDFYVLNSGLTGHRAWQHQKVGVAITSTLGKSAVDADGSGTISDAERAAGRVETARKLNGEGRYDRFWGKKSSLYLLGGAMIDPFSGYALRTHEQLGLSRQLIARESMTWTGEIGADYAQERFVEGQDPAQAEIFASRFMSGFHHAFNAHVAFDDQGEIFVNVLDLDDVRALNNATLSATLSSKLSLKVSHKLTYDHQPVTGFRPLDQTTMVTFVASVF